MVGLSKQIFFLVMLFLIIFVTRLHGKFDVPIIIGLLFLLLGLLKNHFSYPTLLIPHAFFLALISVYATFISIIYGVNEIIFALKFILTLLLFFLLYYVWLEIKDVVPYNKFTKYFIVMVAIHSIIILSAIVCPDFRHALYSLTGYVPRGPEWSRSPGLTISFNATVIVHIVGLWLLVSRKDWIGWRRWCLGLLIISSFIFLGRFISFIGILLIGIFMLARLSMLKILMYSVIVSIGVTMLVQLSSLEYNPESSEGRILANMHHFIAPILSTDESVKVGNYFSNSLASHIYFSDQWEVLLFGNSYAGHIGILTPADEGQTNSDLGVINSINANGAIVTAFIYVFYLILIWQCRKGDWQTVAMVVLLSLALTFKETGLFTSHATPLLFLLFFYQKIGKEPISYTRRYC